MDYKVIGWDSVEPTISFACTHCRGGLKAPLTDAGSEHACPTCKVALIVPGEEELKMWLDQRLATAAQDQRRQQAAEAELFSVNQANEDLRTASATTKSGQTSAQLSAALGRHAAVTLVHMCLPFIAAIGVLGVFVGLITILIGAGTSDSQTEAFETGFIGGACVSTGLWILVVAAFLRIGLEIEQHLRAIRQSLEAKDDA